MQHQYCSDLTLFRTQKDSLFSRGKTKQPAGVHHAVSLGILGETKPSGVEYWAFSSSRATLLVFPGGRSVQRVVVDEHEGRPGRERHAHGAIKRKNILVEWLTGCGVRYGSCAAKRTDSTAIYESLPWRGVHGFVPGAGCAFLCSVVGVGRAGLVVPIRGDAPDDSVFLYREKVRAYPACGVKFLSMAVLHEHMVAVMYVLCRGK